MPSPILEKARVDRAVASSFAQSGNGILNCASTMWTSVSFVRGRNQAVDVCAEPRWPQTDP